MREPVDLAAVRAQLKRAEDAWDEYGGVMDHAAWAKQHGAWLLGEVERLTTEMARVTTFNVYLERNISENRDVAILKDVLREEQEEKAALERDLAQARGALEMFHTVTYEGSGRPIKCYGQGQECYPMQSPPATFPKHSARCEHVRALAAPEGA